MKVFYDSVNDVISVYYDSVDNGDSDDSSINQDDNSMKDCTSKKDYTTDEAANLIIDTLDIYDRSGKPTGFRVFNASKHYEMELLKLADSEILSKEELQKMPNEKVIAKFSAEKGNLYMP